MSLITDKVFYNAIKADTELVQMVGGRIENTTIPVPDEEFQNEPVPYIIISFDGMQNEGFSKDNLFEGCDDKVQISIVVAAEDRETLGDIMMRVRQTVVNYFDDGEGHTQDDYSLIPSNYQLSAGPVKYDSDKPCYWQTLTYNCETNPD